MEQKELHIVPPPALMWAGAFMLAAIALWGLASAASVIKEYRYIGAGVAATNQISVSGKGEIFATPDIAEFSVTVSEEGKEVKDAQDKASKKENAIVAFVEAQGIDKKDIKTVDYSMSPKYVYTDASGKLCPNGGWCPPGNQVISGYTVSETLTIKLRKTEKAGDFLTGLGSLSAQSVQGPNYTIDDEDSIKSDARAKAIQDAEAKAQKLANQLGVQIVRIVGFSEDSGYPIAYMARDAKMEMTSAGAMMAQAAPAPALPTGQNKVMSNVTISYEIR